MYQAGDTETVNFLIYGHFCLPAYYNNIILASQGFSYIFARINIDCIFSCINSTYKKTNFPDTGNPFFGLFHLQPIIQYSQTDIRTRVWFPPAAGGASVQLFY